MNNQFMALDTTMMRASIETKYNENAIYVKSYNGEIFRVDKEPFKHGSFRNSFMCHRISDGVPHVVKCYIDQTKNHKLKLDIKTQIMAESIISDFIYIMNPTKRCLIHIPTLGVVFKCPRTKDGLLKLGLEVSIEPFIPGEYKKFNNTGRYVDKSFNMPQILTHFSWIKSKGEMILCDLQGVKVSNGYIFTDPAIHSVDGIGGETDQGKIGIIKILDAHKCTSGCKDFPTLKKNELNSLMVAMSEFNERTHETLSSTIYNQNPEYDNMIKNFFKQDTWEIHSDLKKKITFDLQSDEVYYSKTDLLSVPGKTYPSTELQLSGGQLIQLNDHLEDFQRDKRSRNLPFIDSLFESKSKKPRTNDDWDEKDD